MTASCHQISEIANFKEKLEEFHQAGVINSTRNKSIKHAPKSITATKEELKPHNFQKTVIKGRSESEARKTLGSSSMAEIRSERRSKQRRASGGF